MGNAALVKVEPDPIIQRTDRARLLLEEAKTVTDAKQVADMARAAEVYGRRQRLAEEAIAHATAIKVDAITLMGEMLKRVEKATGGQPYQRKATGSQVEPVAAPTLAKVGISKKESMHAQALASIKKDNPGLFQKVRAGEVSVTKGCRDHKKATTPSKPKKSKPKAAPPPKEDDSDTPARERQPVATFSTRPSSRAKAEFLHLFDELRDEWVDECDKEEMRKFFQRLATKII